MVALPHSLLHKAMDRRSNYGYAANVLFFDLVKSTQFVLRTFCEALFDLILLSPEIYSFNRSKITPMNFFKLIHKKSIVQALLKYTVFMPQFLLKSVTWYSFIL